MAPRVVKDFEGYTVFVWSNEPDEPMHVHVSRGGMSARSDKIWCTTNGWEVDGELAVVRKSDVRKLMDYLESNRNSIVNRIRDIHPNMQVRGALRVKKMELK